MINRTSLLLFFLVSFIICQPYYKGDWENGRHHGKGEMVDASGNKYEGDFIKGKADGKGIYHWANGEVYDGEW